MKIRPAEPPDLAAIVTIYNQAIAEQSTADTVPWNLAEQESWFAGHRTGRHPILVAQRDSTVVGWISLSEYRCGRQALRHTAEISYYIDAAHRRQGVASALLQAAIDHCAAADIRTLFGILLEDNAGSVALLEGFGFHRWGHLPGVADFDGREVGHLYYGRRL